MSENLEFAPYQLVDISKVLGGEKYQTHLLTRVGDSIIIDRPRTRTLTRGWRYFEAVYVNNLLYLSYEHAGHSYAFKASVLKVSYIPFYHLCLKLPQENQIVRRQLWSAPRFPGYVPVTLTAMHKNGYSVLLAQRSFLVDVGAKGVGLLSESKISRSFLLELEVATDCSVQLKCLVRNVKQGRVGGFYYYGCEIEKVSDPERFGQYLDFLAAATDFFAHKPEDVGSDDFSFYSFI